MCRSARVILLIAAMVAAGSDLWAEQFAYMVRFTDKNNTTYSLSSPLSYLSSRALLRRTTQGIAIDSTDLPVNTTYIDTVLSLTDGKLHGTSKWLNMCVILLRDSAMIHNIEGKPYVSSIRQVGYYADSLRRPVPDDGVPATGAQGYKKTWTGSDYLNTWVQTGLVHGDVLHNAGYTGNGKLIAVMDAGFLDVDTHPGFAAMVSGGRVVDKHNFKLGTDEVYAYDTHGTRALSTMAGYEPGTYIGSAPMASYALYVTEDNFSEQRIELANMLMASERADSIGVDVISSSLGYNLFDDAADNFVFAADFDGNTTIAAQAANMATRKGILFVTSAGNEGGGGWNMILTPGDADSALTIGSVDYSGVSAANSGFGPNAAGRVKPDVCGMGQSAAVFVGSGYGNQNGTSFSTPQIAGWAACLWQAYPTATPYQLRDAIIRCASRYTAPTAQQGYGIPDLGCSKQAMSVKDVKPFAPGVWVSAAPNPVGNELRIVVAPDEDGPVSFAVIDVTGRMILTAERTFSRGYNDAFILPMNSLPAGIYLLRAETATQRQAIKVVKE
ncbi:S8 family serine peptidase [Nemorincola caseinilytica]|uniref:S8 family serine peptidase n=1 Tax=Nemorincola caseinilytica TaxID=2054315 RepID=A0ABP8NIR2_9BACT